MAEKWLTKQREKIKKIKSIEMLAVEKSTTNVCERCQTAGGMKKSLATGEQTKDFVSKHTKARMYKWMRDSI